MVRESYRGYSGPISPEWDWGEGTFFWGMRDEVRRGEESRRGVRVAPLAAGAILVYLLAPVFRRWLSAKEVVVAAAFSLGNSIFFAFSYPP